MTTATTGQGGLRGLAGGSVFRGVRYATASRFGAPVPAAAWTGLRDATRHGPIAPQPLSRLRLAMGKPVFALIKSVSIDQGAIGGSSGEGR